jgi:hypothetical protein
MNPGQIDSGAFRGRVDKLLWFEVVLPVLIVELELGSSLLLQFSLGRVQLCEGL